MNSCIEQNTKGKNINLDFYINDKICIFFWYNLQFKDQIFFRLKMTINY